MIRHLILEDYNKRYIDLLGQLTEVGNITFNNFKIFFESLTSNNIIIVIEEDDIIVSTGSLLIENKIIHNCSKVGHIEDIITHKDYRRKGYAKKILDMLKQIAQLRGCYKVILNCNESNKSFYEKCNFKKKELCMVHYFK